MLVIAILMFIGGLWVMIFGRVPAPFFEDGRNLIEGTEAQQVGALFLLPLITAFFGRVIFITSFGDAGQSYAILLEMSVTILVALATVLVVRRGRELAD